MSHCFLTVQPILEWGGEPNQKPFVCAVCAYVSFSRAKRVVTNVYSLAERRTLKFNFFWHTWTWGSLKKHLAAGLSDSVVLLFVKSLLNGRFIRFYRP